MLRAPGPRVPNQEHMDAVSDDEYELLEVSFDETEVEVEMR